MIYTVTANPAMDYTMATPSLEIGDVNRAAEGHLSVGGKGINVSRVLTSLGIKNRALGFAAGDTGIMLEDGLRRMGVDADFVRLPQGQTRINVKLCGAQETEINAVGPRVDQASVKALTSRVMSLKQGDVLCLCGSLPPGCDRAFYADLLAAVINRNVYTVVDAAGESLLAALPQHPALIKPNRAELCALVGRDLPDKASVIAAANELQAKGAQDVLVSLGGAGAVLVCANGTVYSRAAYCGIVRGTVGAGDSMIAGFIASRVRGASPQEALDYAVAAGCATAFADGLATRDSIERLLAKGACL